MRATTPHAPSPLNVTVLAENELGEIVHCCGTTVPTDATPGFSTGCLFSHTDGGAGTALYVNEGTSSSCDFDAATVA